MGTKPTLWTERVLASVEYAPRPLEWLIAEYGGLIPPGVAWRARERGRMYYRIRRGVPLSEAEPSDEAIRTGRRMIMQDSIQSLVERGRLQRYRENGQVMIAKGRPRIAPTFEEFSARSKKSWQTFLRNGGRKKSTTMTAEQRRKRAQLTKESWARMTPEERAQRIENSRKARYGQ